MDDVAEQTSFLEKLSLSEEINSNTIDVPVLYYGINCSDLSINIVDLSI